MRLDGRTVDPRGFRRKDGVPLVLYNPERTNCFWKPVNSVYVLRNFGYLKTDEQTWAVVHIDSGLNVHMHFTEMHARKMCIQLDTAAMNDVKLNYWDVSLSGIVKVAALMRIIKQATGSLLSVLDPSAETGTYRFEDEGFQEENARRKCYA